MKRALGNLWDWWQSGAHIVISTNIGFDPVYGNNMGAGIALQAANRFPWLPRWYGNICEQYREETPVVSVLDTRLILFPVKPFNAADPERGWAQDASWDLIDRRMPQLCEMAERLPEVALSTVGAGPKGSGGGLDPAAVARLTAEYLGHLDNVTLVEYSRQQ